MKRRRHAGISPACLPRSSTACSLPVSRRVISIRRSSACCSRSENGTCPFRGALAHPRDPPNLRISVVENQEMLRTYANVSMRGFDAPEAENKVYYDTYAAIGSGDDLPWRHYIGWLDEQPVAVSSLLLHAGVAGIYGVATVPAARRQGIGAAMTLAPLHEARARGYAIATLSPSDMGLRIYQRIGFREYCQIHIYAFET